MKPPALQRLSRGHGMLSSSSTHSTLAQDTHLHWAVPPFITSPGSLFKDSSTICNYANMRLIKVHPNSSVNSVRSELLSIHSVTDAQYLRVDSRALASEKGERKD